MTQKKWGKNSHASLIVRYLRSVDKKTPDECWPWLMSCGSHGYGQINEGGRYGKPILAHRLAWMLQYGPIPDDVTIDHLCHNRWCQNPHHMELVSLEVNGRRAANKRWCNEPEFKRGE